jgi:hypothetical protein
MDNTKDLDHTERVRKLLQQKREESDSQKPQTMKGSTILIIAALVKLSLLSLLVWVGFISMQQAFGTPPVSYLQTAGILTGIRAFMMIAIEPAIKDALKEKK